MVIFEHENLCSKFSFWWENFPLSFKICITLQVHEQSNKHAHKPKKFDHVDCTGSEQAIEQEGMDASNVCSCLIAFEVDKPSSERSRVPKRFNSTLKAKT
jgi:hypothetical protein